MCIEFSTDVSDEQLRGMRVVVMGLGRFGGGVGVTRFLADKGADVLVTDLADESTLADSIRKLGDIQVEFRFGEHLESDLDDAELLVVSPAVNRQANAFCKAARLRKIPWTTEVNLFLARCPGRILAVTGSIGKSTTCAMLHTILSSPEAAASGGFGKAFLGGNIGRSLLQQLDEISADDVVVLELSSFQLDAAEGIGFAPAVAGITNVRPHHLERHGDFESYFNAKLNLIREQAAGNAVIVATDDCAVVNRIREIADSRELVFHDAVYGGQSYKLKVPGKHNQANAHMAVIMATALGVSSEIAGKAVSEYSGLPHRLEFVRELGGVSYFNDSKSTSAEAVITAVQAFEQEMVLLCGGKDIGEELDRITDAPWTKVSSVVCFGDAGERLGRLIQNSVTLDLMNRVHTASDLVRAAEVAREISSPGEVVVLSPGCPSYDAFTNYEQRGEVFSTTVNSWS